MQDTDNAPNIVSASNIALQYESRTMPATVEIDLQQALLQRLKYEGDTATTPLNKYFIWIKDDSYTGSPNMCAIEGGHDVDMANIPPGRGCALSLAMR